MIIGQPCKLFACYAAAVSANRTARTGYFRATCRSIRQPYFKGSGIGNGEGNGCSSFCRCTHYDVACFTRPCDSRTVNALFCISGGLRTCVTCCYSCAISLARNHVCKRIFATCRNRAGMNIRSICRVTNHQVICCSAGNTSPRESARSLACRITECRRSTTYGQRFAGDGLAPYCPKFCIGCNLECVTLVSRVSDRSCRSIG